MKLFSGRKEAERRAQLQMEKIEAIEKAVKGAKGQLNKKIEAVDGTVGQIDRRLEAVEAATEKLTDVMQALASAEEQLEALLQIDEKLRNNQNALLQNVNNVERLLEMHSKGVTEQKRPTQIVVSFTSYGKRIQTVPLMLEKVLNQTLKPDRIVLYLSKLNFPRMEEELPVRLLEMRPQGLEIRWCENDLKSYKKLLPAVRDFPEDIIITLDDDLIFGLDLVEQLYNRHQKYPNAVISSRAHRILFSEDGQVLPYAEWEKLFSSPEEGPSFDLLATTGAGTLFPPHCLPEAAFDEKAFQQLCPNADDIWTKVMLTLNGVPVLPPDRKVLIKFIAGTQQDRLWNTNEAENDEQLRAVLEKYSAGKTDRAFFSNPE